uniref:F-actin-capping protein subunit alpha n=1 Tax=Noctiluca scintillans TaxID=2966 RepID=A0A7S1A8A3_NOCSC
MADEQDPIDSIVTRIVCSSPPGHLADVAANCRQLLQADTDVMSDACRAYNEAELLALPVGTSCGVVCEYGRSHDEPQAYLAPGGQVFRVDHEHQVCLRASPATGSCAQPGQVFREAVERELELYPFASGRCPAVAGNAVYLDESDAIGLRVVRSSRCTRPQGFWSVRWSSTWHVTWAIGQDAPIVACGRIDFRTHYGEDGNMHFRHGDEKTVCVKETSDPAAFARELISWIRKAEGQFVDEVTELCAGFGGLKSFRRTLSLSKERFDWRPVRHALIRDVKGALKDV